MGAIHQTHKGARRQAAVGAAAQRAEAGVGNGDGNGDGDAEEGSNLSKGNNTLRDDAAQKKTSSGRDGGGVGSARSNIKGKSNVFAISRNGTMVWDLRTVNFGHDRQQQQQQQPLPDINFGTVVEADHRRLVVVQVRCAALFPQWSVHACMHAWKSIVVSSLSAVSCNLATSCSQLQRLCTVGEQ
jgi:hypothetical protein